MILLVPSSVVCWK